MMKYKLINKKTSKEVGVYNSLADAEQEVVKQCFGNKEISIFNYEVEEIEENQEPNEQIKSFEDAIRYLGISPLDNNKDLIYAQDYPIYFVANDKDMCRIDAYAKLITIATAWNKIDGFVADFSNMNQEKYFPYFEYSRDAAGFVCAFPFYTATITSGFFGSRLCFKTSERAKQFGEQFIDLWNDFLR